MNDFDVFISYSSKDRFVADQLVNYIENAGFSCWIAPRNIKGGSEYSEVIEKAILHSKIFLLVFSEDSATSPWVKSELNIAFSENKYLIPYKIDATPLKGTMRLLLNDKHWIAKNEDKNKQMELLLSAIQNYFLMLEKGETDIYSEHSFYADIFRQRKRKQRVLRISLLCAAFVIGAIIFGTSILTNKNYTKQYNNLVEKAFAIQGTSVSDVVATRNLLQQAREIENEISVTKRKNITEALFQFNFKLDSIYYQNIDLARMFANLETANGDHQAIEHYKLALQAKEDTTASSELSKILSRKGIYE